MANMIHKAVADRHARRNRYVAVVDLFRKKFNCTARECLGICEGIIADNTRLGAQVQDYRQRMADSEKIRKALEEKLEDTKAELQRVKQELKDREEAS